VASNGFPEAHYFLGEAYADDGKDSLAYSQFLSAAKRGFAPACHAIGKCAESGKGCKKNMRLALEMYTKAATAGSLESMYRLGCAEMKGELRLKKDPVKATKWFKRAAAGMCF
jgi:TPR repeat protein